MGGHVAELPHYAYLYDTESMGLITVASAAFEMIASLKGGRHWSGSSVCRLLLETWPRFCLDRLSVSRPAVRRLPAVTRQLMMNAVIRPRYIVCLRLALGLF